MDSTDRKILAILQDDASMSVADIAKRVNLSQTPCWRRIQKLQDAGVITKRVVLVDPLAEAERDRVVGDRAAPRQQVQRRGRRADVVVGRAGVRGVARPRLQWLGQG